MRLAGLRGPMADLPDSLNELDLGNRLHFLLALPLEHFADATVRCLVERQEENELREANLAVPVRIHHFEDSRCVVFEVLRDVLLANKFSKVVRCYAVQEVCVRHHGLAFVLLGSKHLEHLFGRSEETNLVLVFAADQVRSGRFALIALRLLFCRCIKPYCQGNHQKAHLGVESGLLAALLVLVPTERLGLNGCAPGEE